MFNIDIKRSFILAIAVALMVGFSACGSSDDSGSDDNGTVTPPVVGVNSVAGTVATGAGAAATITIVGIHGNEVTGTSGVDGNYTIDISGLTSPLMVKAVLLETGNTLYSFVRTDTHVANVTPITTYLVDRTATGLGHAGGASQLFTTFASDAAPTGVETELETQVQSMNSAISTVMESQGVGGFDHFSNPFTANHAGYDALLDSLDIEISEDDIIIRTDNGVLDTLNYDINVSDINVTGTVSNIATGAAIANASITLADSNGVTYSTTSDVNGQYRVAVNTMRVYNVTISADGFTTLQIPNVPAFALNEVSIPQSFLFPITTVATTTALTGKIIDGRTIDTGISNATMKFRNGYNQRVGAVVYESSSATDGTYSLSLASGAYTVELAQENYYTKFVNINVFGDSDVIDFSLLGDFTSSATTNYFATITLNWDENPSDLDSHLTGPNGEESRFHLYFANPVISSNGQTYPSYDTEPANTDVCANGEIASLDRDRTSSYQGLLPETVTICQVEAGGLYRYYIHQYAGSSTINGGNAEVTVVTNSGTSRTFVAPTAGNTGYHDIWHVFNIDSDGNIYPVNQIIGNGYSNSELIRSYNYNEFSSDENLFIDLPVK